MESRPSTTLETLLFTVVIVLCPGAGAPLSGQAPANDPATMAIRIIPRAGLLSPDAYLYEQYANFSGDGPVEWTNGRLGNAFVLGVGVEVGREDAGAFLRAELLHSLGGWLYAAHSIVVPRQLFDPPHVETTWLDVPAGVTVASLQLILPTRLTLKRARPYFLAGASATHYAFGDATTDNEVQAILPESGTTWGADVGVGLTLAVMGHDFDLQARDAINRYWGKTEHDLVFSVGMLWRIH